MPTPHAPAPPVPVPLRQLLADYPQHIRKLASDLDWMVRTKLLRSANAIPPFERAVWLLEGTLAGFVADAEDELESARAFGDPDAIHAARTRLQAIAGARRKENWIADDALWDYFQIHESAFR